MDFGGDLLDHGLELSTEQWDLSCLAFRLRQLDWVLGFLLHTLSNFIKIKIGFQFDLNKLDNLLDILMICDDHMKHTFTYLGRSFTIGLDAQIGLRWKGNVAEIGKFNQEEINKAIKKIGV